MPSANNSASTADARAGTLEERSALGLRGDPIASAIQRVTTDPRRIWLGWLALSLSVNLAAGLVLELGATGTFLGVLEDRVILFGELIVAPLGVATYIWAPRELLRIIASMADEGIVDARDTDWNWLKKELGGPLVPIAQLGIGAAFLISTDFAFITALRDRPWTSDWRVLLVKAPEWFALFAIAGGALIRVLTLIRFQLRVFGRSRKLLVRPLHPDGCGGLRPLTRVALRLAVVVGLAGAALALAEVDYSVTPGLLLSAAGFPLHALVLLYLVTSLGAFVTPFLAVHARMVETKRAILAAITRERDRRYLAVLDRLESGREVDIEHQMEALHATEQFREHLGRNYPEWPFDFRFVRLMAAALLGEPGVTFLVALSVEALRPRLTGP